MANTPPIAKSAIKLLRLAASERNGDYPRTMHTHRPNMIKGSTMNMVVSDMDGCLLDHASYSYAAAAPALARLRTANIPLLLNTSKTRPEVLHWLGKLKLDTPFVVENGAALLNAEGEVLHAWGRPRSTILEQLNALRQLHGYQFEGFADWEIETLQAHTDLTASAAHAALSRDWSEPLLWHDSDAARLAFASELSKHGLSLLRGGRFWHVQGNHDKGSPLQFLRQMYEFPRLIALGDSQNDVAMLAQSDIAIRVRSPAGPLPELPWHAKCLDTHAFGPAGWNEAILKLFDTGVLPE